MTQDIFLKDFIYSRENREREAETQAEGGAGSMEGAWRGTQFRVSRITPWAKGSAKLLSHQGCPHVEFKVIMKNQKKIDTFQEAHGTKLYSL